MNKMNKKQQQRDTTSLKTFFFLKLYFSHMFLFNARKKLLVLSKTIQNKLKPKQNKKEQTFVDQIHF